MIWYVMIGFFAAVGALFMLWLIGGAFLPQCGPCAVFVSCGQEDVLKVIRRYRWLRDLGLVRGKLLLPDSVLPETRQNDIIRNYPFVEFSDTPKERGSEPHGGTGP